MQFEKTTVERAKAIARSLRIDPATQELITHNLTDLQDGEAWEITLSAEEKPKRTAIRGQIERIAAFKNLPIAVRSSGTDKLVCWKMSEEEIAARQKRGEILRKVTRNSAPVEHAENPDIGNVENIVSKKRR